MTYKPSTDEGIPFVWDELDLIQQQALSDLKVDGTYDYDKGKERLSFLRGDNTKEGKDADQFLSLIHI